MEINKIDKVETVADYADRSAKTLKFCKDNLELARSNEFLQSKMRSKLRAKLLSGIEIHNSETGKTCVKKFDYPVEYIAQVMNPHNRTYNKWVIICALSYKEVYDEFEDPTLLSVAKEDREGKKNLHKTSNKKEAIAKRASLIRK